jgi:hypothetical protein
LFWDCCDIVLRFLWVSCLDGFIALKSIPVILAVLRMILVPFCELKPPHPRFSHYFWLPTEINQIWCFSKKNLRHRVT